MGRASGLNIVISCTDKKRAAIPRALRLRSLASLDFAERLKEWCNRLRTERAETIQALDLYAGEHWHVAKELVEVARNNGHRARLWVCSAGYGLLDANAKIRPYSATFSSGQADSVERGIARKNGAPVSQAWWRGLARWSGPIRNTPRLVSQLAQHEPRSPILVIASDSYLRAMADDLVAAGQALSRAEKLILVSSGAGEIAGLEKHLLPVDGRLKLALGGSYIALNARIARRMLAETNRWPLDVEVLRTRYARWCKSLPEVKKYDRVTLSDEQVCQRIERMRKKDPTVSITAALRALRDGGYACEQSRFRALFRKNFR